MAKTGIVLVYADEEKEPLVQDMLTDYVLGNGDFLYVYNQGVAERVEAAENTVIEARGGVVSDILVSASGSSSLPDGLLKVYSGANAENVLVSGYIMTFSGAEVNRVTAKDSGFVYSNGASLSDIELQDLSRLNVIGGTLNNCTLCAGTNGVIDGGTVVSNLVIHVGTAQLVIGSNVTFTGVISLGSKITQNSSSTGSAAIVNFLLTEFTLDGSAVLDWQKCSFGGVALTVSANQSTGIYVLAENVSEFSAPIFMSCENYSAMMLDRDTIVYHNRVYKFFLQNSSLCVSSESFLLQGDASELAWDKINDAVSYAVELSGGSYNIEVEIGTQGADLLGLANGDYTWQVRNSAEVDNRQTGEAFSQTAAPQEPQVLSAETNTLTDVFFANVDGTWGKGFEAMHVGCKDGWTGTLETVNLAGKSRITDIFAGSDDASVLVLTDDSENGMALFVDDIYSAACGTPEQARLSKIDTIYATAGDDIIDLTSQSFEFANGVTVYGGSGNDVIWANSKENMLFGEAGDDSIIGGNEDDVIIGGIGNDTLHGGGGNDVFCFGDGWGVDTVEQLASGSVVLWFNENSGTWDETTLTYTQGDNSVSVFGVASVELRFGAAEGHEEQYAVLSASEAFA